MATAFSGLIFNIKRNQNGSGYIVLSSGILPVDPKPGKRREGEVSANFQVATNQNKVFTPDDKMTAYLKTSLRGDLLTPEDPAYEEARKVWNGLIDRRPGLIVRCMGVADVITTVHFARDNDLQIAVRGGGHNVAGYAISEGGLVIDLSGMRSVVVDPVRHTVRVEGGATLGDIDHETHAFGLAVPIGVVSATGIGGLALHGGYGWLTRKHGLALDNILAADIVTADGRLVKASAGENEDLFWAIRGGGGNFGVVTSLEFRCHPVGPQVWFVAPFYPIGKAETGLAFFRDFMKQAPDELSALAVLWNAPDEHSFPEQARGAPVLILAACYSGSIEEGKRITRPLQEFDTPIADLSRSMRYLDVQRFFDADYPDGRFYYWKSQYVPELNDDIIRLIARQGVERPSPITSIDIWPLGGAAGRVDPGATAFSSRSATFLYNIESNWDDPGATDTNIAWTRKAFEEMKRLTKGGTYLNFPGFVEEGEDLVKGAYGGNYSRLRTVKTKYDQGNLFRGNFNIRP
jgi:FAD/FMN-containing dehydrogenase